MGERNGRQSLAYMRYQAEPGNEGFSPAKLFSSDFHRTSSFFLLPFSRHFLHLFLSFSSMHFTVFFLVPRLSLGMRVARLCLVVNGREKCEAEPRLYALPGRAW